MKTMKHSRLARVFAMALVICVIACTMLSTVSFAANDAVNDCRYGVLQVKLNYTDDNNNIITVNGGTAFLINDNTLLTCRHVVSLTSDEIDSLTTYYGKSSTEIQSRLSVSITVSRDVTVPATIQKYSEDMDFAILHLTETLNGKTPLTIRSSDTVQRTESVYAIGFPDTSALLQSYNTYTSDDVTVTVGIVNKIGTGVNLYSGKNTDYIQTSCNLDYGNSGGPMVDENGYVVGISQGSVGDTATEYFNAVAIDQVTAVLDVLGIAYNTPNTNPNPQPTETTEPSEATEPTQSQTQATNAPSVNVSPTLPIIDSEPETDNTMLILIIAAVAVVLIIVIVVVVLLSGKKKGGNNVPPAGPTFTPPAPPRPTPPVGGFAPSNPTAPVQGAGETTVLSGGAGETTVLSRNAVSGGSLTRKRTGETVSINSEQFIIGRERKGVNYCIADNSSISRNHVRLTVRGGTTYLTDLNAANGTFVNGVKVMPRQEVALKNGDKITLADEDLEYKN